MREIVVGGLRAQEQPDGSWLMGAAPGGPAPTVLPLILAEDPGGDLVKLIELVRAAQAEDAAKAGKS